MADNQLISSNSYDIYGKKEVKSKKIVFSATIDLAVHNTDSANSSLIEISKKYNGYVNKTGTKKTIIRVKSDFLNNAIYDLEDVGTIKRKSTTGQDVTEEYLDLNTRLENAEKSRKRYLELLEKAENVEATLKVEKELERLNEKIELLKGKINRIDHLDEFSTITIYLSKKKKLGVLGYIGAGLYYSVKWLFVRN